MERDDSSYDLSDRAGHLESAHNIRIKRNSKFLCFRCSKATVMRTDGSSKYAINCGDTGRVVPDTIVECSAFQATGTLSFWDMVKLAKVIDLDEKSVGFKPQ